MTFDGKLGCYELWWNILFFKKDFDKGAIFAPRKEVYL